MARTPAWGYDLDPVVRRVLGAGLVASRADPVPALDPESWSGLVERARHHRLDGLLVAAVAGGDLSTTVEQRSEVAVLECRLAADAMWHDAQTTDIVGSLRENGVEVRILKGPAWGRLDYPDRLWRPTQDLDLLVRGEDLAEASIVLAEAGGALLGNDPVPGYSAVVGKGITFSMPGRPEVDLHRLLIWGPFGMRIPAADLWGQGRTFALGGEEYTTLPKEESLLHAALHMVIHGWRRALNLRDIAQFVTADELDVDRLLWLSRRWNVEAVLADAVLLAARDVPIDPSNPVVAWARGLPVRWRDRAYLRIERPGDPVPGVEALATWFECRTPETRRMLERATFRPDRESWDSPVRRLAILPRRVIGRLGRLGRPGR